MSSKLRAAKIASVSGIRAVIAGARRPNALVDAVDGVDGVGTMVAPLDRHLTSRKLWIGFAGDVRGDVVVDAGAKRALSERGASLLPAGVVDITGPVEEGDIVSISGPDGRPFARGLCRADAATVRALRGTRNVDRPADAPVVIVHADDLVLLTSR